MYTKLIKKHAATGRGKTVLKVFCFIFLLSLPGYVIAQSKDSVLQKLKNTRLNPGYQSLNATIDLMNAVSSKYLFNDPDSAMYYGRQALLLAGKQQYVLGQSRALSSIAKAYYVKGSYDSSLIFSDRAMHISENIRDSLGVAMALNNVGLIYLGHNEYLLALKQFIKALSAAASVKNSQQQASDIFNIGICYDELHDVNNAKYYLNKAIEIDSLNEDHHITIMAYNRMGKALFNDAKPAEAATWYKKVLDYSAYRDNWELTFAYNGLAETYYALGDFNQAINNGLQSVAFAKKMSAKWDAEQALKILAKSYAAAGDFKNAYQYQLLDRVYKDSLDDESKVQVINYMRLQQKEIINEDLRKENELSREKIHLTIVLTICISTFALLLIIAFILLYKNYKRIAALNRQLLEKNSNIERLNVMKDQLFAVVSHDLRGPMGSLQQTLLLIIEDVLPEKEKKYLLENLYRQVNVSNQMLNNLLTWAATQRKGISTRLEKINAGEIIQEVLNVFETFTAKKDIVILHDNTNEQPLMADSNQLHIIVQNLLSNAIKFTPPDGTINIFYSYTPQQVAIHIRDTGAGISAEKQEKLFKNFGSAVSTFGTAKEKGAGIGLMIVKEFIEQNHGHLSITSKEGEGATFSISFPKAV